MINQRKVFHHDGIEIIIRIDNQSEYSFFSKGATFLSWRLDDSVNIIVRYEDLSEIAKGGHYLGATIGPLANRVKLPSTNTKESQIALHGGEYGYHQVNFDLVETQILEHQAVLSFHQRITHPWFEGEADVTIRYLVEKNRVRMEHLVNPTKPMPINLTNHTYFNLSGDVHEGLNFHELYLPAKKMMSFDDDGIGKEFVPISTLMDFSRSANLFTKITQIALHEPKKQGLDHYYQSDNPQQELLRLFHTKSKRTLTVRSSYPGVMLYSLNFPNQQRIQGNQFLPKHSVLAIEPHLPIHDLNQLMVIPCENQHLLPYQHWIEYSLQEEKK